MPSFHRTQILKIEAQPIFSEVNAASADVWNDCLTLMDFYQYQRGYPHAHRDFYFGNQACEGWIDKHLSHPLLHSQSRQSVRERYFKSWKSYAALKKSGSIQKPKPPNKRKNYMTTRFKSLLSALLKGRFLANVLNSLWQKVNRK